LTYRVLIEEKALEFLSLLPEKSRRIVRERCLTLADDPFPGKGGDREVLHFPGFRKLSRLHIGRSYTALYRIFEDEKIVRILAIMTIEQAHKMYGRY
jgi:mRNA-degrading endonuclease RelE of RelBE toxin-antitoxin system